MGSKLHGNPAAGVHFRCLLNSAAFGFPVYAGQLTKDIIERDQGITKTKHGHGNNKQFAHRARIRLFGLFRRIHSLNAKKAETKKARATAPRIKAVLIIRLRCSSLCSANSFISLSSLPGPKAPAQQILLNRRRSCEGMIRSRRWNCPLQTFGTFPDFCCRFLATLHRLDEDVQPQNLRQPKTKGANS